MLYGTYGHITCYNTSNREHVNQNANLKINVNFFDRSFNANNFET